MQPTTAFRMFKSTPRMMRPVPKEEHSAHTITQRLRTLRKIPPELLPIGFVVAVSLTFGIYSMGRKLVVDKQMRLTRQNRVD